MEIYDLHSHIIPNLIGDDGSSDLDVSKQMLEQAFASGTRHIVATPHVVDIGVCASWQEIKDNVAKLQEVAPSGLVIYPGTELMLNWDLLKYYEEQGAYCLNGSRYALVELPMLEVPKYTDNFFYEMQLMGLVPVLAHPERYGAVWDNPDRLLAWMKKGVLLQVNAGSLVGNFGETIRKNAELLVKNHAVACIGSDAHGVGRRNTDMSAAVRVLQELLGDEAELLTTINPAKILNNEVVEVDVPKKLIIKEEKKSLWSRLFCKQ